MDEPRPANQSYCLRHEGIGFAIAGSRVATRQKVQRRRRTPKQSGLVSKKRLKRAWHCIQRLIQGLTNEIRRHPSICRSREGLRKLLKNASTIEPAQDGRSYIELLNAPFLFQHDGSPAEYGAGLALAIERGWLWKHESGTVC